MNLVSDKNLLPIEQKVLAQKRLTRTDGLALFQSDDLLGIGALANYVRLRRNGHSVYFVRNRHINYSNVCRSQCRFCAFGVSPEDPRAYTLSHDEIVERARQGVESGARELHIVGGIHPDLPFEWYVEMIERLRAAFPTVHIKAFTAVEIDEMARTSRRTARQVLQRLAKAGLNSLPGGGAEILSDRLREQLCSHKASARRWLAIMRMAHHLNIFSTATMLYGHVETAEDRIDHMLALRELQDETGGFMCFVPLAFQPARTRLSDLPPVSAADSLKTIAIARLMLDNFAHIKAYWIVLGIKLAEVALSFGADDLHGTVFEEQIAHEAGATTPLSLSADDLTHLIESAGFVPVEHNSIYVPTAEMYVQKPHRGPAGRFLRKKIPEIAGGERRLEDDDALQLFRSDDILMLGRFADRVRQRLHPEPIVTYVIDRNINYSNVCVSGCRFCAFYRSPDASDGYLLDRETLGAKLRETIALGGTQVLLQGGLHPDLPLEWYENLVRWIREEFGLHVHGFSPPEIVHLARVSGLTIRKVILRLREAGQDTIPGGGAEILSDRVRRAVSPNKCTADEWIEVMRTAHELGMRTTATMMFGHVETHAERVEHLRRLRDLQDRTGGFTAFIPWPYQPRNTELGGRTTSTHDYLKTLALSRLYLDNFANIQASWVTQGREVCQIALLFGANDVGSTMIEENVVRAAGVEYRLTRADLELMIRQIGREPRQRDCYYRLM
jgi:dehypoxanthine futalosine cyclase/putative menaquinone biosynthesis radical SAM enzyme